MARAIALRLLERAPRTRAELERALSRRGVPETAAMTVLDRFTEVGLIDDAAFAQAWVDSRHAGRGLGRRALSAELRRRGVGDEAVRDAIAAVSAEDEEAAARALAERKVRALRGLPRDAQLRRVSGLLARRGYPAGLALTVAREVVATAAEQA